MLAEVHNKVHYQHHSNSRLNYPNHHRYKEQKHRNCVSHVGFSEHGYNQECNSTYGSEDECSQRQQRDFEGSNCALQDQQQHQGQRHHLDIGESCGMLESKTAVSSVYEGISSLCLFGRRQKVYTGSNLSEGNNRVNHTDGQQQHAQQQEDNPNALGGGTPNSNAQPQADVQIVDGVPRIMGGNKRSLFIGINYTNTWSALQGCHADVESMKKLVVEMYGFPTDPEHMLVLMDTEENMKLKDRSKLPLRKTIKGAMKWLVRDAQPGDSLFFHYSGHGIEVKDTNDDEDDGQDSAIAPVDYLANGLILDDDIHDIMVRVLPAGVKLTAILDCCNSGTAMDLPYMYLPDGREMHDPRVLGITCNEAVQLALAARRRGRPAAAKGANSISKNGSSDKKVDQAKIRRLKTSLADVIMFSGCTDFQTSADAVFGDVKAGAMSWAFNTALRADPMQSYAQLLGNIRDLLRPRFSQTPQLSSGRRVDMNKPFCL